MDRKYDLIVIGAGPGGYVSAIKAAQLGMHVAVIESHEVGGTCLNRGCIPTKALLHSADIYRQIQNAAQFGITVENAGFDIDKIYEYKESVSSQLRGGIEQLFQGNQITLYRGRGMLQKDGSVLVTGMEEDIVLCGSKVLIATGSVPAEIPIPGINLPGVMNSDELLSEAGSFKELTIIGGGVIGVEFATVFASLGYHVTIIEALPALLANMDKEISQNLKMILKKRGVEIYTDAKVERIINEDGLKCCIKVKDNELEIPADRVLVAIGRKANTKGLLGEGVTLEMDGGRISVDKDFQTSIKDVYAVGDIIPGIQLAHAASSEGICAVEHMVGRDRSIDLHVVPSCIYTDPEIACVGMTADEAKQNNAEVRIGKFLTNANGKSLISKEERGFVKLVFEKDTDILCGAQLMCARATDMIGEMATAIANKMTSVQLLKAMRAHPTLNECIGEAVEDSLEGSIHTMPKKKRK